MASFVNKNDGKTYHVPAPYHGEGATIFYVLDDDGDPVASYREKWRAENHAITGCGCASLWHYYHGEKHEGEEPA